MIYYQNLLLKERVVSFSGNNPFLFIYAVYKHIQTFFVDNISEISVLLIIPLQFGNTWWAPLQKLPPELL
jgi:hypothetical protein